MQADPYNKIGLISSVGSGFYQEGTGILISKTLVLTAGHNFLSYSNGQLFLLEPQYFSLNLYGKIFKPNKYLISDFRYPQKLIELY